MKRKVLTSNEVDVIQESDEFEPESYLNGNGMDKIHGAVNKAWSPTVTESDLSFLNQDEKPAVSHGVLNRPQHKHKRPTVDELSDDIDSDWLPMNQTHTEESMSESDESSNSVEMGEVLGLIDDLSQHCVLEPH